MADLPEKDQNTGTTNDQGQQTTSQDIDTTQNPGNKADYDKMIVEGAFDTQKGTGGGMEGYRSLGTVGGGTIPSPAMGSGTPIGGMNTSDSTVSAGGTTGGGTPGLGATVDRGKMPVRDMTMHSGNTVDRNARGMGGEYPEPELTPQENPTSNQDLGANRGSTIDRNAQGSIGGRNPSQPQTAMGDRDADIHLGHSASTAPTEPMSSRSPDKVNADQETGDQS